MTQKQIQAQYIYTYMLKYNEKAKQLNKKFKSYNEIQNKILSDNTLLSNMRNTIHKINKEQQLNQAYGKETLHYSEKPKEPIKTKYLPELEEEDYLLQEYYHPLTLEDVL